MILEFERLTKQRPQEVCFIFVEEDGRTKEFTYLDMRFRAVALAKTLQEKRVGRGDYVSLDMSNCPAFVTAILAAAYGGFSLVALNHRLTAEEKDARLADLRMQRGVRVVAHLTEEKVEDLLERTEFLPCREDAGRKGLFRRKGSRKGGEAFRASNANPMLPHDEAVHFAEHGAALFDETANALVLFTSGTSGRPKAVCLNWGNLCNAATASNASLGRLGEGFWQAALPLFHIGGFEIVVRSILNARPFLLYRRFDARRVLDDTITFGATHLSVVDKMLQDMIALEEAALIKNYRVLLLGGAATNPITLVKALAQGASVFASYGMTETSSQIASRLVDEEYEGRLRLLPGYDVQIINPDERGFGQLAVKGPGVFSAYLNAQAAFTADGFFLTGDTASFTEEGLKIQERLSDMFVSGGENIYPAEIQDKLLRIPGVGDAYVFGAEDVAWGRRPVAMIERSHQEDLKEGSRERSPQIFATEVRESSERRLSKLYRPRHICVMDEFPRTGIGKVDKEGLRRRYEQRLEVKEVRLYHIKQKLVKPFVTAKTTMRSRESIIVEIVDYAGRTGVGECVAFPTDWYSAETLPADRQILENYLIPLILQQVYLHPSEVSTCLDECTEARNFPLAKGALEPAFWDLYGKICEQPLWQLIGGEASSLPVAGGMVLGIMSIPKTLDAVRAAVNAGYSRVKLKIKPGDDIERVRAVREAFPELLIFLDANQSYTERDIEVLKALDELDIYCIEEPLDPRRLPRVGPTDFNNRLARLQDMLSMAVCLDESIVTAEDAWEAQAVPALNCFSMKIGKWGGIQPALDFCRAATARGVDIWMGGMYETGVSKTMHAAFETLPGITVPGDLSSTARYFTSEIVNPPFEIVEGKINLNQTGFEEGLGCCLNHQAIEEVLIDKRVFAQTSG